MDHHSRVIVQKFAPAAVRKQGGVLKSLLESQRIPLPSTAKVVGAGWRLKGDPRKGRLKRKSQSVGQGQRKNITIMKKVRVRVGVKGKRPKYLRCFRISGDKGGGHHKGSADADNYVNNQAGGKKGPEKQHVDQSQSSRGTCRGQRKKLTKKRQSNGGPPPPFVFKEAADGFQKKMKNVHPPGKFRPEKRLGKLECEFH